MTKVTTCSCGVRTTEPFVIRGVPYCTMCAEDLEPRIVAARERRNWRAFAEPERVHQVARKMMHDSRN